MERAPSRRVLREVSENTEGFAPRREIPRTPPRGPQLVPLKTRAEGDTVGGSENPSNQDGGGRENVPPDWCSPFNNQRAQAACFTPSKTLARSPPPPLSLTEQTRLSPELAPITEPPAHRDMGQHQLSHIESGAPHIQPDPSRKETLLRPSLPISKTVGVPAGLVCTKDDIAFLQHMQSITQHKQLQREVAEMDKAVLAASQEKEQLQLTSQKIETDLREMRDKYVTTLSNVHTLQSTFEPKDGNPAHSTSVGEDRSSAELSHTHLSQLRHMQKLLETQMVRTERDIERKVSHITLERDTVEKMRERESVSVQEMNKDIENVKMEKKELRGRVKKAQDTKQAIERELESLQSQLKHSKQDHTHMKTPVSTATEVAAAEERLRILIRRCDLYVKRHQILKQLRLKT